MIALTAIKAKFCRVVAGLGCPLLLVLGGCEPISPEILQEFAVDLARGALAAGLL